MLKNTPKYLVSKATTLPTKNSVSKKLLLLNKIKINWENEFVSIVRNGELSTFLYYSQVYLRSLPNQLMDHQNTFFQCMWRLSRNGCFAAFCTLGYCLVSNKVPIKVPTKAQNKLISPIKLFWG